MIIDLTHEQKNPPERRKHRVGKDGKVVVRDLANVTGIVVHQTACVFGVASYQVKAAGGDAILAKRRRALDVACHAIAFREQEVGVVLPNPLEWWVNHGNGFNAYTLGLEIEGLYPGLLSRPQQTTWGGGNKPTPMLASTIENAREALRYLVEEGRRRGAPIRDVYAHRQSNNKPSDPGEEIWKRVVLEYGVPKLGLVPHQSLKLDDGRPIPVEWDPAGFGYY